MTFAEYELLLEAHDLREVDLNYRAHQQAFLNLSVKATRKNGSPVYRTFRKFFNYRKEIDRVKNKRRKSGKLLDRFLKARKEGRKNE